jgi:hypothetical protein
MGMRTIDGPGEGKKYVTTDEAAAWMNVSDKTLKRMAERTDWLLPVKIGDRTLWDWADIFALAQMLSKRGEIVLEEKSEKKSAAPLRPGKPLSRPVVDDDEDASS